MQPTPNSAVDTFTTKRRYDLDWLRILSILLLTPFHTALIYGSGEADYWLKAQPLFAFDLIAHFIHQWHMPLLFLVSGAATWFALRRRNDNDYIRERAQRLLVPLLLLLIFYPLLFYFAVLGSSADPGSFLTFYPYTFLVIPQIGIASFWGHLWFLVYLFVYSLLGLLVFRLLQQAEGHTITMRLAAITARPGGIFLFAVPLIVIEVVFRASWGNARTLITDWANLLLYGAFFTYGYLLQTDSHFTAAIHRYTWIALGLAVLTFGLGLVWVVGDNPLEYVSHNQLTPGWYGYIALRGLNSWLWVVALLGLGQRYLNRTGPVQAYLNESLMAIYLLHLPVNVVVGYGILQLSLAPFIQFVLIGLFTLVVSFLIYELLIRRWNGVRCLFGMRRIRLHQSAVVVR